MIARRFLIGLLTLAGSSLAIFIATQILPGDISNAVLGQNATPQLIEALRLELGLDRPAIQRYLEWLLGLLTGDLGRSLASKVDVVDILLPRLENTLLLAAYAALVTIPIAFTCGVISAIRANTLFDRSISAVAVFLVSIPEFAVALVMVVLLAVKVRIFPAVVIAPDWSHPFTAAWQLFLPMVTLLCTMMAHMVRMTRAAVLDVMGLPFVEFAVLKGIPWRRIYLHHIIPNAMGLIVSVIALNLGYLISGVAVVEVVFSYPGLGRLMVDSISYRDIPVIQATAQIFCALYITFNLMSDLAAAWINPRVGQRA